MVMLCVGNVPCSPLLVATHIDDRHGRVLLPAPVERIDIDHLKRFGGQGRRFPRRQSPVQEAFELLVADANQLHHRLSPALFIFDQ